MEMEPREIAAWIETVNGIIQERIEAMRKE